MIKVPHLRYAFYLVVFLTGTLLAFSSLNVPKQVSQRLLTFAERVTYQRAIEDVYWRHRIWPKENPNPKPSLDSLMSQGQLESKVASYLRKSQALEDYWQRPLTAEQLQAEMDRMARDTKQPEVLRELFAALGDDPFVIAECLARPVLAERLKFATVEWRKAPLDSMTAGAENQMPKVAVLAGTSYTLPVIASPSGGCTDDTWAPTSLTDAPDARSDHTALWTGSEMIVWGGFFFDFAPHYLNTGGRYIPSTDSWTATSTTNAPAGRTLHTAVWTGTEMIVWGGYDGGYLNTGGKYDPATDAWTATTTTGASAGRYYHTAVWTGSQMIVWGGRNVSPWLNTGGRYNPSTNSWTATSAAGAPSARLQHTAVWTGSQMIVWGGGGSGGNYLNTGGRYNPLTDGWTTTSTTNVPDARYEHTAVWTGGEMIVWGGSGQDAFLNTGGRYNPTTDSWTATDTTEAPAVRYYHTAVWKGTEMIVWGGVGFDGSSLNTGGRYNPATDIWIGTSTAIAPAPRQLHTAVWTGSEMIVWGGYNGGGYLSTGGKYCAGVPTPPVVLYDQYNNAGINGTLSATFTDVPAYNSDLTDDFVVPGGQTWNVRSIDADGVYFNGTGPATDWNVFFYTNSAGFPGTQIYTATHEAAVHSGTTFTINLPTPAVLTTGTYWVEIQPNMTFSTEGEWGWTDRTLTSNNAAAWRNPIGGFGICESWSRRGATCNIDPSEPDQVYRLIGTLGGPTPTPTASPTPTATPTPTPTPTPCAGRCEPTPRPRPTPAPRPTP